MVAKLAGGRWIVDTGSPASFGDIRAITLDTVAFPIARDYLGLTAQTLTSLTGVEVNGLLGTDVLNAFDLRFDLEGARLECSTAAIPIAGEELELDDFMGIPIVEVDITGEARRMFVDTGAQVSYFQDPCLEDFPEAGRLRDFFPGMGEFETQTHHLPVRIGSLEQTLRCGALPELLGLTLAMAGVDGIVGSALFTGRRVAYLPRRSRLVLEPS